MFPNFPTEIPDKKQSCSMLQLQLQLPPLLQRHQGDWCPDPVAGGFWKTQLAPARLSRDGIFRLSNQNVDFIWFYDDFIVISMVVYMLISMGHIWTTLWI